MENMDNMVGDDMIDPKYLMNYKQKNSHSNYK